MSNLTKQLYLDGKMIGPGHGSMIAGPAIPVPEDREDGHYKVLHHEGHGEGKVFSEVKKHKSGRWIRRSTNMMGKLTPWYFEDTVETEKWTDNTGYENTTCTSTSINGDRINIDVQ